MVIPMYAPRYYDDGTLRHSLECNRKEKVIDSHCPHCMLIYRSKFEGMWSKKEIRSLANFNDSGIDWNIIREAIVEKGIDPAKIEDEFMYNEGWDHKKFSSILTGDYLLTPDKKIVFKD